MTRLLFFVAFVCACSPALTADDLPGVRDDAGPVATTGGDGDGDGDTTGADDDAAPPDDVDRDGWSSATDCDDRDPAVNPAAVEICGDGVDNNCNGDVDTDLVCLDSCEAAEVTDSYFGCEFWAVDLPQFGLDKKFAISVSNPSPVEAARVTIETASGSLAILDVGPRGVATFEDPSRANNVGSAGIFDRAFRVRSDRPVAAYQFNSIDTFRAASTDASMLFARHNLARRYFAMDYSSSLFANNNFVAVVAVEPDTRVELSPTADVLGPTEAILQPFELLLVLATAADATLTGTRIEADKPVAVFGGNRCANIPALASFCDHLEQQIFPRVAIGSRYLVGKTHPRQACDAEDYLRILADDDGTTVSLVPAVAGPWTLGAGEWVEVAVDQSVEVLADKPVMVGQFMRSSGGDLCAAEGDPSFILQVPVAQFRRDYAFLVPPTYDSDYIGLVAPATATVMLDGVQLDLSGAQPLGDGGYVSLSVLVSDGAHRLDASDGVGVTVYGYGGPAPANEDTQNVSYGYAAGLDLSPINPVE